MTEIKEVKKTLSLKSIKKEMDTNNAKTFEALKSIGTAVEMLVNKEKVIGQTYETKEEPKEEGGAQIPKEGKIELNGQELEIFNKYFDESDGFKATFSPDKTEFTVEVPLDLSNTTQAYKELYKKDLRTKKVDQNDTLGSIDNWCKRICGNLKYNKQFKLKI